MERKGIIQKVAEPTPWISSMIVVAKPGKIRISLDPPRLEQGDSEAQIPDAYV